ncbi:TldD/PmbA family protein [candidate division CSSED10-310 bacterium]|uniref:TldD/PmbA family protein n=1 Tax=candidate division CSSED10-310 bacterium TaxID=2855610 RepID=A0ABV6YS47_UNCC1
MMNREIVQFTMESLLKAGADKAQCLLKKSEKSELNVEWGDVSLFRTTFDTSLDMTAILQSKKGSLSLNKTSVPDIEQAVVTVIDNAASSKPDSAYDIAEKQPDRSFRAGPTQPDLDLMYDRIKAFLEYEKKTFPMTNLEGLNFDFTKTRTWFLNSNGVDFEAEIGVYTIIAIFTSKEGRNVSSFNYSVFQSKDITKPIKDFGSFDILLRQSAEQIETGELPQKFIGDVIITPDCLPDFLSPLTGYLRDYALITGNSAYKNKLDQKIADSRLSLHCRPTSDEIAAPYFFTREGVTTRDSTIIDQGVLKSYLLSLYGANKTGKQRAANDGGCYVVDPGEKSQEDMIRSINQGILLCRFSGGRPSDNGDFSGVAKNSYYIEDGEVRFPLTETMVSGNLVQMLLNIKDISGERINFGYGIFPWIQFHNLTISGK